MCNSKFENLSIANLVFDPGNYFYEEKIKIKWIFFVYTNTNLEVKILLYLKSLIY
jgi:hypothetical protein